EIDPSSDDLTGDRRFPDGTPGRATIVFELPHSTNVDGENPSYASLHSRLPQVFDTVSLLPPSSSALLRVAVGRPADLRPSPHALRDRTTLALIAAASGGRSPAHLTARMAYRMWLVTASGCEIMITCEPATSTMSAPARWASERTRSAPMALSPVATAAHDGSRFQAGGPAPSVKDRPAPGPPVA